MTKLLKPMDSKTPRTDGLQDVVRDDAHGRSLYRLVLRDRLPTVQEAAESVERPLTESYWWLDGLNFNRPVMCSVSISCHVKHGASVRVYFAEEMPASGFDEAHFAGRAFRMWGPVKLPAELSSQNNPDQPRAEK